MNVLFSVVLPIFALVGAGWIARRYEFLGATAASELNRFVVYLGMPALLFQIMANAKWHDLDHPGFTAAFALGCAVTFGVTVFIRHRQSTHLADASLDGLNGGYANVGFIGFPLCMAAFGPDSLPLVTIAAIITVSVLFGVAVLLVEVGLQPRANILNIVKKVAISLAKNPMFGSSGDGGFVCPVCAATAPRTKSIPDTARQCRQPMRIGIAWCFYCRCERSIPMAEAVQLGWPQAHRTTSYHLDGCNVGFQPDASGNRYRCSRLGFAHRYRSLHACQYVRA
jgi:hypothetical protein